MPLESVYLNGGFIGTTTSYQRAQAGSTDIIVFVGAETSDTGDGTTIDLTGIPMQPGDIVLVISGDDSGAPGTATGYTSLASISSTGDVNVMYKIMPDPVDSSVTGLTNGGSDFGHLAIVFRGVDQTTPIDATTTTATNTAGDPDPAAITTVTNGAMVVALAFLDDDLVTESTAPSGYIRAAENIFGSGGAGGTLMAFYKTVATAGSENPGTIVTSGDDWWWAATVALRPGTTAPVVSNDGIFNLQSVLETLSLGAGSGGYRFVRWVITGNKGDAYVQASEFRLQLNGTDIDMSNVTVSNPGGDWSFAGSGERPLALVDNNTATKWIDLYGVTTTLIFDFGSNPVNFNGYRWATANDSEARDPDDWTIEVSNDYINWTTVDTVTNAAVTSSRLTFVGPYTF